MRLDTLGIKLASFATLVTLVATLVSGPPAHAEAEWRLLAEVPIESSQSHVGIDLTGTGADWERIGIAVTGKPIVIEEARLRGEGAILEEKNLFGYLHTDSDLWVFEWAPDRGALRDARVHFLVLARDETRNGKPFGRRAALQIWGVERAAE